MRLHSTRPALVICVVFYVVFWVILAVDPVDRLDWLVENMLVFALAAGLFIARRSFRFSDTSLLLILAFLSLHAVGSHYRYADVPYDEWWRSLTGHSFNELFGWQRNQYDRLVHFSYGLLLAYPIREFFLRVVEVRGFWAYFLPFDFTMSTSALYELIEWGAAVVIGGDLGVNYLGAQGDVWDAQKDMALAGCGALIAILITAFLNRRYRRDFAREWTSGQKRPPA